MSQQTTRSGLQMNVVLRTTGRGKQRPAHNGRIRLTLGALAALMVRWFRVTQAGKMVSRISETGMRQLPRIGSGPDPKRIRSRSEGDPKRKRRAPAGPSSRGSVSDRASEPSTGGHGHGQNTR